MKNILTTTITAAAILVSTSYAQAAPGDSAAAFMRIGVGARPASMGEAYAGVSGDLMALYSNPAGLSSMLGYEFSFSHAVWLDDVNYSNLAAGGNILDGYAALGINYLSAGSIKHADNLGAQLDTDYTPSDLLVTAAYSRGLGVLNAGGALKLIHSEVDGDSATGVAVDLGVQKYFGLLNAGIVLQNVGTGMTFIEKTDPLPMAVRAGVSYPFAVAGIDILTAAEASYSNEVPFAVNAGANADYPLNDFILSLRLGLKSNAEGLDALSHITAGFGVQYSDIAFDYAIATFQDLGLTHRISLGYRLN